MGEGGSAEEAAETWGGERQGESEGGIRMWAGASEQTKGTGEWEETGTERKTSRQEGVRG